MNLKYILKGGVQQQTTSTVTMCQCKMFPRRENVKKMWLIILFGKSISIYSNRAHKLASVLFSGRSLSSPLEWLFGVVQHVDCLSSKRRYFKQYSYFFKLNDDIDVG